ncbi:hypothetical protein [Limnoglobus roseus]|uniref:Uncharacterized protein n=1 Tax=Limnoglobus roseus TaxID=2598579 RepID=A0A5C1A9C9_9BACT|nr:hypothetical protein [Limnoglobus roseus]QEL15145.1 hypothetical protein PX52LOC_02055 [Limnoglobus roseus]
MIGEVVESRPTGGLWAGFFVVLGLLFGIVFLVAPKKDGWPTVFLPFGIAAGIWLGRDRPTVFRIAEDHLQFEQPTEHMVRFEHLEGVVTSGDREASRTTIQLNHADGVTVIPDRLTVASHELLVFLESKWPRTRSPRIPASLHGYREDQVAKFGEDHIYTFAGRPKMIHRRRSYKGVYAMLGLAAAAVVMGVAGRVTQGNFDDAWMGGGLGVALFGLFIALILFLSGRSLQGDAQAHSGLVITPVGLALVQGDSKGKLRWDEVKAIEYPPVKRMGVTRTANSKHGIGLLVDGAYIVILDYYNRPAPVIYNILCDYWNGGRPA